MKEASNSSTTQIPHSASPIPGSLVRVHSVTEKLTRTLPLEDYLIGVLSGEAAIENQFEALKAQAVASRSFAVKNLGRHQSDSYDFCSTTHCQRFVFPGGLGGGPHAAARRAVEATRGEILRDDSGQGIDAYFHAACGGMTANIETLWGVSAPIYLRGVRDDYCASMPHRRWSQTIPAGKLLAALKSVERTDVGARLDSITVNQRDATGRAETIVIEGERRRVTRGWDFKIIVGRSLGWQLIKSSRFEVSRAGANFIFRGSGFGHGLGLCQEGAHVMAQRGMNYRQILIHYFPSTTLGQGYGTRASASAIRQVDLSVLAPALYIQSNRTTLSSEHFRASFPADGDRHLVERSLRILEAARADLLDRLQKASLPFPQRQPFEIVFHSSTAEFIASTGQPGWTAGATRDMRIELQPLNLLRARGILAATLRHEFAHVAIEIIGRGQAPLWFSEGMAIHFAGEGPAFFKVKSDKQISRDELEKKLAQPASNTVRRELYALAYREVLRLINVSGESNVWSLVVDK